MVIYLISFILYVNSIVVSQKEKKTCMIIICQMVENKVELNCYK